MTVSKAQTASASPLEGTAERLRELELDYVKRPRLTSAQRLIAQSIPVLAARGGKPLSVRILRSFTIEPVVPHLRALLTMEGINAEIVPGGFNAAMQELLDPESELYTDPSGITVVLLRTADFVPELWTGFAALRADDVTRVRDDAIARLTDAIKAFCARSNAPLIVANLECPGAPALGILDAQLPHGQMATIRAINVALVEIASAHANVHVFDYDALVADFGRSRWNISALERSAGLPLAPEALFPLAQSLSRHVVAASRSPQKVLAVDLDNTLWGGVIGEDGIEGVKLGDDALGRAYRSLQQYILDLHHRGVLLVVVSKNNEADVMPILTEDPRMILRRHHFAASRIDWQEKSGNLKSITSELNLGLDAFVFLDDNPIERLAMRSLAPGVRVIELPDDPEGFEKALRNFPGFEVYTLTTEDRVRSQYYAAARLREEARSSAATIEDYLHSLSVRMERVDVKGAALSRVAQLTQKTNQFNVTTKRYGEAEIEEIAANPGWIVRAYQVSDRFGDNGIVGLALVTIKDGVCEIDTLLMSCRVIKRGVETAMLADLAEAARARGCNLLRGRFRPTAKNVPASDVFTRHGFELVSEVDHESVFDYRLSSDDLAVPPWIYLKSEESHEYS